MLECNVINAITDLFSAYEYGADSAIIKKVKSQLSYDDVLREYFLSRQSSSSCEYIPCIADDKCPTLESGNTGQVTGCTIVLSQDFDIYSCTAQLNQQL